VARSDEIKSLTQDIVASYEARLSALGQLVADTHNMLGDFRTGLREMGTQLKIDLTRSTHELTGGEKGRLEQAKGDLKQRQAELKERIEQVSNLLGEFKETHQEMSNRLKTDLTRFTGELTGGEKGRLEQAKGDLKQRQAEMRGRMATVSELLGGLKAEREKATKAWQELANIMQGKGGMAQPRAKAAPGAPPAAKMTGEDIVSRAGPLETTGEASTQREQVFAYLSDHPNGARMTELETEFNVPRIQMARILGSLIDEDKVEKRDMVYFAL